MPIRNWLDGILGNTPLSAARLNDLEADLEAALLALARVPDALFAGAVSVDADQVPTSANVVWPDGVAGVYSGTASEEFPGALDSYSITRAGSPTRTYTQPAVTRNASGAITNRPEIIVS